MMMPKGTSESAKASGPFVTKTASHAKYKISHAQFVV